jgi:integrase
MTIRKEPSGRFRAVLKVGRNYIAGRTFDTRREAQAWLNRERAAVAGGVDPRAGRRTVRSLLPVWLEERRAAVSPKTYASDAAVPRLLPPSVASLWVSVVTDREIQKVLTDLTSSGYAEASVRRFRASLSSFFAWAVRERLILLNPVLRTRVPRVGRPKTEMYPFSEEDLEHLHAQAAERDQRLADLLLVAAWTGLRWSELRALKVRDFVEVPMPLLVVQRAQPEGGQEKGTKSGRTRRVPVADRILPIVRELAGGRVGDERLFVTSTGHALHATAFKRTLDWPSLAEGRRIHDLRHTAACLWLARGVDASTVQAWMGHASIATTNIYLHHLGTGADRAGLDRLNAPGHAGGTPAAEPSELQERRNPPS